MTRSVETTCVPAKLLSGGCVMDPAPFPPAASRPRGRSRPRRGPRGSPGRTPAPRRVFGESPRPRIAARATDRADDIRCWPQHDQRAGRSVKGGEGVSLKRDYLPSGNTIFKVRVASFRTMPGPSAVAQKRCVGTPFSMSNCGRSRNPCCVVRPSLQRTSRR